MNYNIKEYMDLVKSGTIPICKDQLQMVARVERTFKTEDLRIDENQLEKYLELQKYFSYSLLPWEKFCFALHNCVYRKDGQLRWPILVIVVGRGAGKNGYLAFENFALLTPINGIRNYDIDMFATSEQQCRATFDDVYEVLESNAEKMKRHFYWTKERITNTKTNSHLSFHTSAPRTKDGGRPGKVDFDELHEYENSKLIDVVVTGLGKKPHPRRTTITTFGYQRDGPFDEMMQQATQVLSDETIDDNGMLYFICRVESVDEIKDKRAWPKANPSYLNFPTLRHEMDIEFAEFLLNETSHAAFPTKRLNFPTGDKDAEVTSWENIVAANSEMPDLTGKPCVWGVDFASTQDFVAAGLLFKVGDMFYWITHSWVCKNSKDLSRIRAPLDEFEQCGLLTFVDDVDISPEIPIAWLCEQRQKYQFIKGAIDHFRCTIFSKFLRDAGFDTDKKTGNVKLTYLPEQSVAAPKILRAFVNHQIRWGDNKLMRWYTRNTKQCNDDRGNVTFGKIEAKSRKTDGFMALVAAFIISDVLDNYNTYGGALPDVYSY